MYDLREIDGAIAELENSEPTIQRVEKLAALYIVKNQHQTSEVRQSEKPQPVQYYADAAPPTRAEVSGSEFLDAVSNTNLEQALKIIDELMSVLSVTNPRAYRNVMRKLERSRDNE